MWQDIYGTAGAQGLNDMFQNFDFNFGGQFNQLPAGNLTPATPSMPTANTNSLLPAWAQQGQRQYIDPFNNAAFRPQDVGDGSATTGYGTGQGFYSGFGQDLFDTYSIGEGEMGQRINFDRLNQFLGDRRLAEVAGPNNTAVRFLEGSDGSVQGPVDTINYTDNAFRNAALAAMMVTGANVGAAMGNGFVPGVGGTGAETGLWGGETLLPSTPGATNPTAVLGAGAEAGVTAPATQPTLLDYGLNTAPQAQTGGVLGGTSNGVAGGIGEGLQAAAGPGTTLAAATGTGQGIGVMNPVTGAMGPTPGQIASFAPTIGNTLPPVGQSLLPPSMQNPTAPTPTPNVPSVPGGTGTPGTNNRGGFDPGSLLGSIFGMYNANRNRERYDDLINRLDQLYAADSPYARQMQDELERRDSAAGRASQYGPRSVELAAKLTDSRRQALGQMTVPLAASMMMSDRLANNTNNLLTNPNGNVFDAGRQVFDWGSNAWDWVNRTFPDIFGGNRGG